MFKLLSSSTRIEQTDKDRWRLDLIFATSGRLSRHVVTAQLDINMILVAAEPRTSDSLQVSVGGIGLGLPSKTSWTDLDKRTVTFVVAWFDLSLSQRQDCISRSIDFRWVRPSRLPKTVKIQVSAKSMWGSQVMNQVVTGYNVSAGPLIEVVTISPPADSFYFSPDGVHREIDYIEVCRIGGMLQRFLDSESWAFTGPHDLGLWESEEGLNLLANQYNRIWKEKHASQSTRLTLCPFALSVPDPKKLRFLEMLMVQELCGIQIRVVMPQNVESVFGFDERVGGGFGSGFAAEWDWAKPGIGRSRTADIYLESDRIQFLRRQYCDLMEQSLPWQHYLSQKGISFSAEAQFRINRRFEKIKSRASIIQSLENTNG